MTSYRKKVYQQQQKFYSGEDQLQWQLWSFTNAAYIDDEARL